MPCPQCEHCKQLAERAKLTLSTRLRPGAQGTDIPFYREFGAVYDLAVANQRQPMRAIREANPDLSVHQLRGYLKRARALGLVLTPPATGAPAPVVAAARRIEVEPAQEARPEPENVRLARALRDATVQLVHGEGRPVTAEMLLVLNLARSKGEATELAAELAEWLTPARA